MNHKSFSTICNDVIEIVMPWTDRNRITDILNAFLNSQKKLFKISHCLITISKMWTTVYNQMLNILSVVLTLFFFNIMTWCQNHHCSTNSYRWKGTPGIPFPSYVTPSWHNSSLAGGKTLRYKMPVCSPLKDKSGIWKKTENHKKIPKNCWKYLDVTSHHPYLSRHPNTRAC